MKIDFENALAEARAGRWPSYPWGPPYVQHIEKLEAEREVLLEKMGEMNPQADYEILGLKRRLRQAEKQISEAVRILTKYNPTVHWRRELEELGQESI